MHVYFFSCCVTATCWNNVEPLSSSFFPLSFKDELQPVMEPVTPRNSDAEEDDEGSEVSLDV